MQMANVQWTGRGKEDDELALPREDWKGKGKSGQKGSGGKEEKIGREWMEKGAGEHTHPMGQSRMEKD
jgi:hypothetical protein